MIIVRAATVSLVLDSDVVGGCESTVAVVRVHDDPVPHAVEVSNVLVFGQRRPTSPSLHHQHVSHLANPASVDDEDHICRGEN